MKELVQRVGTRAIGEAAVVWFICLLLATMVLDDGYTLGYYLIASFLFWSGSLIYFRSRNCFWPSDLWAFRLGPFILLVLGLVGGALVEIFRNR
jgi:hypothetical protein